MKKILFILLLIGNFCYAQTFSNVGGGNPTGIDPPTFNLQGFVDSTQVLFIGTKASTPPTDNPTISGDGGRFTFTKRGTVVSGNIRMICYTYTSTKDTTVAIVFTYAEAQTWFTYQFYTITFVGAVKKTRMSTASNSGSGADPSIAVPYTALSSTAAFFINDKNPFGATAESGWSLDFNGGNAFAGICSVHRNSTTDNTVQITAAASVWVGMALQLTKKRIITIAN